MSNYSYIKIEQMDFVVEYDDNKWLNFEDCLSMSCFV